MIRAGLISICAMTFVSSQALAETPSEGEALASNPCASSMVQDISRAERSNLKLHIDISGPDCKSSDMIIMITGGRTDDGLEVLYAFRDNAASLVSGDYWGVPIQKRLSDFSQTAVRFKPASDAYLDTYLDDDVVWFGTVDKEAITRAIAENALTFTHSTGCNSDVTYAFLDGKIVKLTSTIAS